jgi:beta-mannosidase
MSDLDDKRWLPASEPGSVILSLAAAGVLHLSDVYSDPEAFGWIGKQDWVFRTWFSICDSHAAADHIEMVFDGLDTIAQIWVNEKLVGKTDSMFISHRFDVKPWIQTGRNTLTIKFASARVYAENMIKRSGEAGDLPRVYVRKAQYSLGSAAGPELLDCGLSGPVRVECFGQADIDDIHIRTIDCNADYADMRAAVSIRDFRSNPGCPLHCRLTVRDGQSEQVHTLTVEPRQNPATMIFRIKQPNLWQPRGHGQAFLYSLTVELFDSEHLLDRKETSFGIRTVRIIQGQSAEVPDFGFEVNGSPIYIQGATWLPTGMFHQLDTAPRKINLLRQMSDAHINMLRVWGGGIYEDDLFYNQCDRLGILVWQDFMFASAYYPDGDGFADQVHREACGVIRRLRNHPCLALWCGNSHIDRLHTLGQLGKGKKFPGKALFHRLLPDLLSELDPNRDYIPTAPDGESDNAKSAIADLWDIWNHDTPAEAIFSRAIPPFVVETGFQSLPDIAALRTICPPESLTASAAAIEKHNYHPRGSQRLAHFAADYFTPPKTLNEQIYQSQVVQARTLKNIAETLRANSAVSRGLLLWSANDFWPGAGFSMIDGGGTPKALYYYARRFFAPVLICLAPVRRDKSSEPQQSIVIINNSPAMLTGQVVIEQMDMKGRIVDSSRYPITVAPFSVSRPATPAREFTAPICPEKNILRLAIVQEDCVLGENIYLYQPDKYLEYRPLEVEIEVIQHDERTLSYTLQSRCFVKDLQLIPSRPAALSDNFFDLLPRRTYEITATFADRTQPDLPLVLRSAYGG